MGKRRAATLMATVLGAIALAYWPVVHGDFVWDDVVNFRWNTWLTEGDQWKHYIFRDFNYWKYYFRPLVVGLFTLQLRLFDGAPGPMHAVSLAIHLLNTAMVGLLALRCSAASGRAADRHALPMAMAMGLFGLHPAVIEAVAWVGCQYDLLLTFFTLLGLLANTCIRHRGWRALAVAACFFLAACTKEAAIAFPLVLALFDWTLRAHDRGELRRPAIGGFVGRNAATWIATLVAGLAYLALRHWAMGPSVMPRMDGEVTGIGHLQMVCFTYMRYWLMLFAPTAGMAPIHEFDPRHFLAITPASVLTVAAAIAIVATALYFAIRRASALAAMVLVVTATLLPVLRILPAAFNPNLYHDRYLVCGLAVACAMLPLLRPRMPVALRPRVSASLLRATGAIAATAWLATSAVAIRSTIPLWANETSLWNWAYATDRDSTYAISNLLELHLAAGRLAEARVLADRVVDERIPCAGCLLDVAALAIHDRDQARAQQLLRVLERNRRLYRNQQPRYARVVERLRVFQASNRQATPVPPAGDG